MAAAQGAAKPLWQRGSHMGRRPGSADTVRRAGIDIAAGKGPKGAGGMDRWMLDHPGGTVLPEDLPAGEIDPRVSGVLGVYEMLPQATCRLFQAVVADQVRANRGAVPDHGTTGSLLSQALRMPVVTHHMV